MVRIQLAQLLAEKNWTLAELIQKTGIESHTVKRIYKGVTKSISVSHLEIICETLRCEPSDILEYIPNTRVGFKRTAG